MAAAGKILVTARRVISAGSRRTCPAARAMRSRTAASLDPRLASRGDPVMAWRSGLPHALGHAAVAVLHAVVQIERRHGPERLVVQALLAETFLEIFLEIVQRLQFLGQRGLLFSGTRPEELLVPAIHQGSDF